MHLSRSRSLTENQFLPEREQTIKRGLWLLRPCNLLPVPRIEWPLVG